MALGRRCDLGCETWPNVVTYAKCPVCHEKTTIYKGVEPMAREDADKFLYYQEFERFYARRCEERGITVDGPLVFEGSEAELLASARELRTSP